MSSVNQPITPERFAAALESLPVSALHAKAAELRNSIAHLQDSNVQLKPFADDGDEECAEAIVENEQVIERMRVRVELLKNEVEGRGLMWIDEEKTCETSANGEHDGVNGESDGTASEERQPRVQNGRLSDEELARRLREQMEGDDGDGMHL